MGDDDVRELLDIEAIKQLKARYFRFLDGRAWDELIDCFAPAAEMFFARPGLQPHPPDGERTPDGIRVGRDELRAWLASTSDAFTTVHNCHMPEITIVDHETATARWSMTDATRWTADGAVVWARGYGHYDDRYVRTPAGWRIVRSVFARFDADQVEVTPPSS